MFEKRISDLKPWKYNHYQGDRKIITTNNENSAALFDDVARPTLRHILNNLFKPEDFKSLRALDLGCMEGHYSDIICSYGFKEVVSIDLSQKHIERAKLLLKDIKEYKNSTIIEGNVLDPELIIRLGKFDLIFFHGLLYHLSSPVLMFNYIEKMINNSERFYLLLGHQFHMHFINMINPYPVCELQLKRKQNLDSLLHESEGQSTFELPSIRFNVAGLYRILPAFGYETMIQYDTPKDELISKYKNYDINLILSKCNNSDLIKNLNNSKPLEGLYFSDWDGKRISNYSLRNNPLLFILKFFIKLFYRIGKIFGMKKY